MKLNIRNKISIAASGALFVVFLFTLLFIIYSYIQKIEQVTKQSLTYNKEIFAGYLKTDSIKLSVTAELISRDERIKELFYEKDFDKLNNYCLAEFNNLKEKFNITHWYFINPSPQKTCFLRVHRPKMRGDTIKRTTFLNAVETKSKFAGLELGSRAFAYRVVQPCYYKNTLLGYIEIGVNMNKFSELMKAKTEDEYALLISKEYLNEKKWETARKIYREMTNWNAMQDEVLINHTTDKISIQDFRISSQEIPDDGKIINTKLEFNNKVFVLGVFPIFDAGNRKVGALYFVHDITQINQQLKTDIYKAIAFFILILFFFILFTIILVKRSVIRPIQQLEEKSRQISEMQIFEKTITFRNDELGAIFKAFNKITDVFLDINEMVKVISNGEIGKALANSKKSNIRGELDRNFREMLEQLNTIIVSIQNVSEQIELASLKISTYAQKIAFGSNEQAASIEEVSASMEEMTANVSQNTENALLAEKISINAVNGIDKGYESFKTTLEAMKEIAKKISVIGNIAEKTDILAINAAIEAARAGEHGKGFAVVATEIRKLAENSKNAAHEIDKFVNSSVITAEESGKLLSEITPEIKKTAILVQEIANAGNEQNSGANQINDAIQELTKVITQNSSAADQMTASSKDMSLQAIQLEDAVAFFKTTNDKTKMKTEEKKPKMNL